MSIGEFLTEHEAKRHPDKIVAIGVYLHDQRGLSTFTRDDVKAEFQNAGEPVPANLPRDFQTVTGSKWVAVSPGSAGEFYVTKTGRAAVTSNFSGDAGKVTRARLRRRPGNKAKSEDQ